MEPSAVFVANLPLIERVVDRVCRHWRIYGADAEDFASHVKLALIDNDYQILRKWEERSSLGGYLTVVVQRLLIDERTRSRGRWHASAEATRLGRAAVLLEALIHRDRRSIDEAMPLVTGIDPNVTRAEAEAIVSRLRERTARPRLVELDEAAEQSIAANDTTDAALLAEESRTLAARAAAVIRNALASFTLEERMIIRFRYGSAMSAPKIAEALRIPLRTLYRRLDELHERLRRALTGAGIDAAIVDASLENLDFGLQPCHEANIRPSSPLTAASEEVS
jgi:RNA polymerase sigma factor (sigma-70 family)